jgi:WD40 repeat protein
VWDLADGKSLASFPCGHCSWLALSPDGTLLAVNTDEKGGAMLLDAATGKELRDLAGHTAVIQDLAFSPDGTLLATGSEDGTARTWDVATGKDRSLFHSSTTIFRVAFSQDGSLLAASGNDALIRVMNGRTGAPLFDLSGHRGTTFGVAFSPDGRYLATSSTDATVKIWDVSARTSALPLTLYGHTAAIYRVVFSPDGKRLATASRDGTSRVYALDIDDLIAIAKLRLTRWFTADECLKYLHLAECPTPPQP